MAIAHQYTTSHQATSNSTINTEDLFLELKALSTATFTIKRVRVGLGDGTQTTGQDGAYRVRLLRYTTTTAGTTTTPTNDRVPRDAAYPAAVTTSKAKSGTTACVIGTGTVTCVDWVAPNGRALWEWLARDDGDMIVAQTSDCFCVAIQCSVASQLFTVSVDHLE